MNREGLVIRFKARQPAQRRADRDLCGKCELLDVVVCAVCLFADHNHDKIKLLQTADSSCSVDGH